MRKFSPATQVDFVIIGSGAAGGAMAKELSASGFEVVVLEQGPRLEDRDFKHDELKIRNTPALVNDHALQPNTFRKTAQEKAQLAQTISYGRCVGGGTVHYTGSQWRLHEIDFVERSRWGAIEGTGFADWPLTYADLEPFYVKAEYEFGVSGIGGGNPFDSPRSKTYSLPPFPIKYPGGPFRSGLWEMEVHPFSRPSAV